MIRFIPCMVGAGRTEPDAAAVIPLHEREVGMNKYYNLLKVKGIILHWAHFHCGGEEDLLHKVDVEVK